MLPVFMRLLSLVIPFIFPFAASGQWYQGSAQVAVTGFDFDEVRTTAIKRAITNASFQASSYINAEEIVLDGLLQSSKSAIRSEGRLRRVEILSETVRDDMLTVEVRVDFEPQMGCNGDEYRKSLVIAQMPLLNAAQGANGGMFNIGSHVSKRFEQQLLAQENVAIGQLLNQAFLPHNSMQQIDSREAAETARYLAGEYASQFILFGFIRDISLFEQVKDQLLFDDVKLRRNFTMQIYLFDGIRGSILMQREYHGESDWLFAAHETVDTYNSLFWRSDYGRMMLNTINGAVTDIDDVLRCQQSLAQVISKGEHELVINMGNKHGLKARDEFRLMKYRLLVGANGQSLPLLSANEQRFFTVSRVDSQSAVLTSASASLLENSHLFDFVSPKPQ
ncbi:flagellar assembly protein T N-terminal domain-containing protein [Thalassomonas actiniarum]|uniref:Flagellar assembly protein T N-terminal domain-containing protein n=1 Tax=Thalassomonas actiniarum TaxID=485447 RepID=A0AAF0C3T2_9GAMM|nr:flagellar assembly protein T N-terminal domain-containing protein [Thalassomonas actiniarum]WDD99039.1 flagellar assembly protein T N-terminal domain-containing protein [Thalassomonas actiniarum]